MLVNENAYITSIRGMKIRLSELEDDNKKIKKLRSKRLCKGWKNIKEMFYYQGLPYVLKIICSKLISRHHNDLLVDHFGIEKTQKLIARKYYWLTLQKDVKAHVKGCNICLISKVVCYKSYEDLQLLPILTYW